LCPSGTDESLGFFSPACVSRPRRTALRFSCEHSTDDERLSRASGAINFEENFRVTSDKTSAIQQISDASFEEDVVKARRPVLIDFWAEWCGPCKAITPMLNELAEEYRDKVTIVKLNVDENPRISQRFNVRSIPTLILFKNGQVEGQKVGAPRKSDLVAFLDSKL
jgi:thioredoxin